MLFCPIFEPCLFIYMQLSRALDGGLLPELLPSAVIAQAKQDVENAEKLRVFESVQRPVERKRDTRIPT